VALPAQVQRPRHELVLAGGRLSVALDLAGAGLTYIDNGQARV